MAAAELTKPCGVSVMPDGTFVVADGPTVKLIQSTGSHSTLLATIGESDNLKKAAGTTHDARSSSVYVSDFSMKRVSQWSVTDGAFVGVVDIPGLDKPVGLDASPAGDLLAVADKGKSVIHLVPLNGAAGECHTICRAGSGDGELKDPYDVSFSPDGLKLVVADWGNQRVVVMDLTGTFLAQYGGGTGTEAGQFAGGPRGVVMDNTGNVLVADAVRVQTFTAPGATATVLPLTMDNAGGIASLAIDRRNGCIVVAAGKDHNLAVLTRE